VHTDNYDGPCRPSGDGQQPSAQDGQSWPSTANFNNVSAQVVIASGIRMRLSLRLTLPCLTLHVTRLRESGGIQDVMACVIMSPIKTEPCPSVSLRTGEDFAKTGQTKIHPLMHFHVTCMDGPTADSGPPGSDYSPTDRHTSL